jgi:hypothetical protein
MQFTAYKTVHFLCSFVQGQNYALKNPLMHESSSQILLWLRSAGGGTSNVMGAA